MSPDMNAVTGIFIIAFGPPTILLVFFIFLNAFLGIIAALYEWIRRRTKKKVMQI